MPSERNSTLNWGSVGRRCDRAGAVPGSGPVPPPEASGGETGGVPRPPAAKAYRVVETVTAIAAVIMLLLFVTRCDNGASVADAAGAGVTQCVQAEVGNCPWPAKLSDGKAWKIYASCLVDASAPCASGVLATAMVTLAGQTAACMVNDVQACVQEVGCTTEEGCDALVVDCWLAVCGQGPPVT